MLCITHAHILCTYMKNHTRKHKHSLSLTHTHTQCAINEKCVSGCVCWGEGGGKVFEQVF